MQSVTGTAVFPAYYDYGVEGGVAYTKETKDSPDGSEWIKTYTDMLGRRLQEASAGGAPAAITYYNTQNQPWKQQDEDGVTQFATYTPKGEPAYTILATNSATAAISDYSALLSGLSGLLSGTDRITLVTNDVTTDNGTTVRRTRTFAFTGSDGTPTLLTTDETSADGSQTWNTVWNSGVAVTRTNQTVYAGNGWRYLTTSAPDGSYHRDRLSEWPPDLRHGLRLSWPSALGCHLWL